MQNNLTENDSQNQDIDDAFKKLLVIGKKIEFLTQKIAIEISLQPNKTNLEFLQKIKLKISKLAKLYQEELSCIDIIKPTENGTAFPRSLNIPLFILEERTWKQFKLTNPWKELKLKKQTLLNLAIEQEREQQGLSTVNHETTQLKQQLEDWSNEMSLLGISVQYKTHSKLNQQEFEKLLNRFSTETKVAAIALVSQSINLQTADTVLLESSEIEKIMNTSHAIANQTKNAELEYLQLKNQPEKIQIHDIDLSTIDEEIAELNSSKSASGYLKRLFTGSLGAENKEECVMNTVENIDNNKQRLLTIDYEIEDYLKKLHAVIKGSTNCDARLLEYLHIRIKSIVRLLIEKDFLLKYHTTKAPVELEHYLEKHLNQRITLFTTEILEPIKEMLLFNIDYENKEIVIYNKKYKKNKPLKQLNDDSWDIFSQKLLAKVIR